MTSIYVLIGVQIVKTCSDCHIFLRKVYETGEKLAIDSKRAMPTGHVRVELQQEPQKGPATSNVLCSLRKATDSGTNQPSVIPAKP